MTGPGDRIVRLGPFHSEPTGELAAALGHAREHGPGAAVDRLAFLAEVIDYAGVPLGRFDWQVMLSLVAAPDEELHVVCAWVATALERGRGGERQ